METSSESGVAEARIAELVNDAEKKVETPAQMAERHQTEVGQEASLLAEIKGEDTEASDKLLSSKEIQNDELRRVNEQSFVLEAEVRNASRSWLDKLMGRNKVSAEDIMKAQAEKIDMWARSSLSTGEGELTEKTNRVVSDNPEWASPFKTKKDIKETLSFEKDRAIDHKNAKIREDLRGIGDTLHGMAVEKLNARKKNEEEEKNMHQ